MTFEEKKDQPSYVMQEIEFQEKQLSSLNIGVKDQKIEDENRTLKSSLQKASDSHKQSKLSVVNRLKQILQKVKPNDANHQKDEKLREPATV